MIKARHHSVIYPLFKWLTRFLLKRNFNQLHIESSFSDFEYPVLIIANHIGWWDGFWIEYLNQQKLHRRLCFMMLEEQLKKHWYFRYTGGYPIKRNSKEILKSIDYTIELLKDRDNAVLIFPQGRINSLYNSSFHFEKGVQHIIDDCKNDVHVLLVSSFIDYLSHSKPSLFIYTKTYPVTYFKNVNIEEEYNQFYAEALNKQKTLSC